jgi:hypothetical protein
VFCRLCGALTRAFYTESRAPRRIPSPRRYELCPNCDLVQVHRSDLPTFSRERTRYEEHRNSDRRYHDYLCEFAQRRIVPLIGRSGHRGRLEVIDYGSGPVAALAPVLRDLGLRVFGYDPFFGPFREPPSQSGDIVVLHEVVEHFSRPGSALPRAVAAMRRCGFLVVEAQTRPPDAAAFARWTYRQDPTHVAFYTRETFAHIARRWGFTEVASDDRGAVFCRP